MPSLVPRPSTPSVLIVYSMRKYCKQSKTGGVEGLNKAIGCLGMQL